MKKTIGVLILVIILSLVNQVAFADLYPFYKGTVVVTQMKLVDDGLDSYIILDLPFTNYYQLVVSEGRNFYGYPIDTSYADKEALAYVVYSAQDRPGGITDDSQEAIDFEGNLGSSWDQVKFNPYYTKHYPYVYDDGEPVRFAMWGEENGLAATPPHDPLLWTDEIFSTISVGSNPNNPNVTPEPISTILFLVGGIPMAAGIYRKRKRA